MLQCCARLGVISTQSYRGKIFANQTVLFVAAYHMLKMSSIKQTKQKSIKQ